MIERVIKNTDDFDITVSHLTNGDTYIIPYFSDHHLHPAVNRLSVVFLFSGNKSFIYPVNHSELPKIPLDFLKSANLKLIAPNKKELYGHLEVDRDIGSIWREFGGLNINLPRYITDFLDRFSDIQNSVDIVPISRLYEHAEGVYNECIKTPPRPVPNFIESVSSDVYGAIERNGIQVDLKKLIKFFGSETGKCVVDDKVYCKYNLYTKTGRPSNIFGGINFSALNKTDGSRSAFISRFEDGLLVQYDYESYHLRLIANDMGYDVPTNIPIHAYLAQQYYSKSDISEAEYQESKKKTFFHLYSESRYTGDIDFIKKVDEYKDIIQTRYEAGELDDIFVTDRPTRSKIFNYYVQNLEYKTITKSLRNALDYLSNKGSKIILTTYDSILIDYCPSDNRTVLTDLYNIFVTPSKKFPVNVEYGKSYNNMKRGGVGSSG